jgi:hypothetical protein
MDGSNGRYYVTNDPNCGKAITASAYTTTFSHLYICGQCKGGCAPVEGGELLRGWQLRGWQGVDSLVCVVWGRRAASAREGAPRCREVRSGSSRPRGGYKPGCCLV